ncbi:hypothetical protein CEJ63_23405 [Acinetobacter baumannii]|nr:hypothetical protein CEJ63_23405 [Acinetobacter baumannii]
MEYGGLLALQGRVNDAAAEMTQAVEQCASVPELCDILALQSLAWTEQAGGSGSRVQYARLLDRTLAAVDEGDRCRTASSGFHCAVGGLPPAARRPGRRAALPPACTAGVG